MSQRYNISHCLPFNQLNPNQSVFQPLGDSHLVTSSRDGQVRLAVLSSTGVCRSVLRVFASDKLI